MTDKQRILIVEDDEYIRDLYQEVLTGAGYDIAVAVDGEEGLVKASEGGYDLILLDVMMPKLDGLRFLEELSKKPPQNKNGSIVLLTNLAHETIVQEALKKGAKDFLLKADLTPDTLLEKVRSFLAS